MRNEVEVMRVVRVPPMGKLVVQAGTQRLERLDDTNNEQIRHRLLAAIGELIAFAGGYEVLVDAGVAPLLAAGNSATASAEETLNAEQAAFLDQLERELKATTNPVDLGSKPTLEELERMPLDMSPPTSGTEINLVSEIDTILQRHVQADPTLAGRSIHLEQPSGHALQIRVDGQIYQHPTDIEDEQVRQVLKQALKEWEMR